jgi:nitrogen fixation-related uncharacterized protein
VASILINTGILPKTFFWVKNELFKLVPLSQKSRPNKTFYKTFLPFDLLDLPDDFPLEIQLKEKKIPRWIISSIPFFKLAITKFITKNDHYDDDQRLIDSILHDLDELNSNH